jgi:hypothetical protein
MSEQLKHKMQQWEATPPPGSWDAIASRLSDMPAYAALSAKLYDAAIAPPPGSWPAIAAALEEPARPAAPVKPLYKRPYFQIAAAAILLFAIGGFAWYAQNQEWKRQLANIPVATTPQSPRAAATAASPKPIGDNPAKDDNYLGYSKPVPPPAVAYTRTLKAASVSSVPASRLSPITTQQASMAYDNDMAARNMSPLLTNTNYVIITGPNGETTRASLKIADALRYIYSDDDTIDATDKSNNENSHWKKRLQEWRTKIISSHFIPATTNFLDIIDLKDLIDEKQ